MARRDKAISKKRDRPGLARERARVGVKGERAMATACGAVSVRVGGGEVEAPGLKTRDRVNGVGRYRKQRDSFAGALLAQGNVGSLKSGERSRSKRPGRYLFMEAGALRPAGINKGAAVSVKCGGRGRDNLTETGGGSGEPFQSGVMGEVGGPV